VLAAIAGDMPSKPKAAFRWYCRNSQKTFPKLSKENRQTLKRECIYKPYKKVINMALKIKIKKCGMVRKIEGVKKSGFYGKVIANGKKSFEEILKASCKNTTLDFREAELACKMMIDGIAENLREGYIVDLGAIGTLYPAVNGKWDENADNLQLADMKPKVNYKAGADIAAAVKGASLSWTNEPETDENTVTDDDNTQTGGNGGGTTGGELEG